MNIKRPSESWEMLSDGLWFDWKEYFLKTACVRTAHTLHTGFVGLQVGCVPKGTHAVGSSLQLASAIPNSFPNRTPPPDNALRKFFGHREPCPAENTAGCVRRFGAETGGAGGYGAWFASKKLLKYGKFTGSGGVWGEGSGNSCLAK